MRRIAYPDSKASGRSSQLHAAYCTRGVFLYLKSEWLMNGLKESYLSFLHDMQSCEIENISQLCTEPYSPLTFQQIVLL